MLTLCPNEQLIAHLFDTQPDSVIWLVPVYADDDPDNIVDFVTRYSNRAASLDFGTGRPAVVGEHLMASSLTDNPVRKRIFDQCLQVWKTGESMEFTYHDLKPDRYFKVQRRKIHEGILDIAQDCSREVKAELRRQEQERKYLRLLDASGDGVLLLDAIRDQENSIVDFRISFCNKWGRKIGRISAHAIGKSLSELFPHLQQHEQFQWHKQVIETGEPFQFETTFRTAEGQEYGWFIVSLTRMGDSVISRYTDISERKRHEEQIERQKEELQGILDSSINAVMACEAVRDKKGRLADLLVNRVNLAFTTVTGITTEEAEGATFFSLFPCFDAVRHFAAYRNVFETGESLRTEMYYESNTLKGWFDISAVKRGQHGVVISFNDITPMRNTQDALERSVSELKQSNQSLEEFAYVASHDLQEPLRKIQLFSDRLRQDLRHQLDTGQQVTFERIHSSANRLRMLVDNLMAFSSINKQQEQFEPIGLHSFLQEMVLDFDETIKEKSATVSMDNLPVVSGDKWQLYQLFQNLLGNALKYTRSGVPPQIFIRSKMVTGAEAGILLEESCREKQYVQIAVEDNGIGFDMRYAEKIFQVFQRLHGKDAYKGTGIGLAIVQKVVKNHNGFIHAQSQPGKGSVFTVLLPC